MVKYTCTKCGKLFNQKGHYQRHMKRKYSCTDDENLFKSIKDELFSIKSDLKSLIDSTKGGGEKVEGVEEIRYIDLCCGIGGFRVGINAFKNPKYSFKCVYSADIKEDAIKTYNINFNESMGKHDIYNITNKDIPPFDMLCAGFPCQPFSSAGAKKGFKDKRGGMIFKIVELCKAYKPKIVILENVYNLLTLEKGEVISKICDLFHDLDYNISYKKLNSVDFGVPQSRERVYIVATLDKEVDLETIKYQLMNTLSVAIEGDEKYNDFEKSFTDKLLKLHEDKPIYGYKLQDKRGGSKNIHSWDIGYNGETTVDERALISKLMTERRKKKWATKKGIVWMDGMPLTYDEIASFYDHPDLKEMLDHLVEMKYLKLEKCKDLVGGKRVYKEDSEPGYNICKGKLSFPISKILDPNDIAPTLTATDSSKLVFIIDNKYIRRLTNNELKRICGFPDNFIIPAGVNQYDLFGNMVTPPVITKLLDCIFSE